MKSVHLIEGCIYFDLFDLGHSNYSCNAACDVERVFMCSLGEAASEEYDPAVPLECVRSTAASNRLHRGSDRAHQHLVDCERWLSRETLGPWYVVNAVQQFNSAMTGLGFREIHAAYSTCATFDFH